MKIQRFEGTGRMSRAVIAGDVLYLCGQTADPSIPTVTEQTRKALEKCEAQLVKYGSDKRHLLTATIYIKDMSLFAEMNAVWDAWIEDGYEPTRACVAADMAAPGNLVEVVLSAALI